MTAQAYDLFACFAYDVLVLVFARFLFEVTPLQLFVCGRFCQGVVPCRDGCLGCREEAFRSSIPNGDVVVVTSANAVWVWHFCNEDYSISFVV